MKFSVKDFFGKCNQILNGKLRFLCSIIYFSGMVKKKVLVIWFVSNAILSLYFILKRIQLEITPREQPEEEQTSQEHMQVFERRYADFSSINEHGVAQNKKIQEHRKTSNWRCTFRIYKK